MWHPSETSLFPVPAQDQLLRRSATSVLRRDGATTTELRTALAPLFPYLDVRIDQAAGPGADAGWYLFRDGAIAGDTGPPAARPRVAVLDDAARVTEADDGAVDLLGADRETLRNMDYAAFVAPAAAELLAGLAQLLDDVDAVQSRWLMRAIPGRVMLVDVAVVRDGAGAHRHLVSMQPVPRGPGGTP